MKRKIMITGAAGGMGRACARLFGATHDLVLTDVAGASLQEFANQLTADGYLIASVHGGSVDDPSLLLKLKEALTESQPFTLIHTAGLSPAQADWQSIMRVNLLATEKLLAAVEQKLQPGSVAIVIASAAGHLIPPIPDVQGILDKPLEPDLFERIGPIIEAMAAHAGPAGARGVSYSLSKQAVIRLCEKRASLWGKHGARVVTISPGLILTPMGRRELTDTPGAREMSDAAPAGRSGTAMDIALAAQFLASENASFITGTDLKVDGGSVAAMHSAGA